MTLTASSLAVLLKAASEAHHDYEKQLGKPDENWPQWYADWIVARINQTEELTHA